MMNTMNMFPFFYKRACKTERKNHMAARGRPFYNIKYINIFVVPTGDSQCRIYMFLVVIG